MKHQSPLKIDKNMIAPNPGEIKNAIFREINTEEGKNLGVSKDISEVFFLPDGQTFSVEAGRSFVVKTSETTWTRADFYETGQMSGPLIYSEVEHESPAESLKKSEEFKDRFTRAWQRMMIPVASLIVLAYALLTSLHQTGFVMGEAAKANFTLLTALAVAWIFHLAGIVSQYYISTRPGYNNDQEALCIFRKMKVQTNKSIPFSGNDRKSVKQAILA